MYLPDHMAGSEEHERGNHLDYGSSLTQRRMQIWEIYDFPERH